MNIAYYKTIIRMENSIVKLSEVCRKFYFPDIYIRKNRDNYSGLNYKVRLYGCLFI